ncbi:hypothetical protein DVB37_20850 [Achromobacter sp. B7]|jgi:hypothetical protein|uniref:hypothetical protein n=1 Tax=Achromobacter sp. B7 TaxID=2282475 RepID=UPI000E74D8AE|nr:hypothetical protein [Achromobacter sp. B7]AYD66101.1 hypothetical protein DVB37_20850 [Achromobacter sp. B7]
MPFKFIPTELPAIVKEHFQDGYHPSEGLWLVRPLDNGTEDCIRRMNDWLRGEEAPYPLALSDVIWFGDDGVGNVIGWNPINQQALLWNPEDEEPWHYGSVEEIWNFVQSGYQAATP